MRIQREVSCPRTDEELQGDFRSSRDLGRVRVGQYGVYFERVFRTDFLPCGAVGRYWLRQEEANGRMCCSAASFDQFFLMVEGTDGKVRKGQVLSKELGREALNRLAVLCPHAELAFRRRNA